MDHGNTFPPQQPPSGDQQPSWALPVQPQPYQPHEPQPGQPAQPPYPQYPQPSQPLYPTQDYQTYPSAPPPPYPAPEQPAYPSQYPPADPSAYPPVPPMPDAGFPAGYAAPPSMPLGAGQYPPQQGVYPGWNSGYANPPSVPMGAYAPPSMPYGMQQPVAYQPVMYAPAPPPQPKKTSGWVWALIAAGCLIVVCAGILFISSAATASNAAHRYSSAAATATALRQRFDQINSEYPTVPPYPTDTPEPAYAPPTDTPVPAPTFYLTNESSNMQIGNYYSNGQITSPTTDFHSGDPYAMLLNLNGGTFGQAGITSVNFELWQRTAQDRGIQLYSKNVPVGASDHGEYWYDSSMGKLMGSEPPGQYRIYITTSGNQYLGYIDFNYYG